VRWHDGTPLPDGHYRSRNLECLRLAHVLREDVAHNFIIIHGRRHWPCAPHFNTHMETRGFLRMEGENWDANGLPL
jgi:hypothetical protein